MVLKYSSVHAHTHAHKDTQADMHTCTYACTHIDLLVYWWSTAACAVFVRMYQTDVETTERPAAFRERFDEKMGQWINVFFLLFTGRRNNAGYYYSWRFFAVC